MRRFRAEFVNHYPTYSFGYCDYAELEDLGELGALYAAGYLPYSGDPTQSRRLFYLCRSLRIDLAQLAFDKKRRYQQRQVEELGLDFAVVPQRAWLAEGERQARFRRDAFAWLEQRFEQAYLNEERLDYVLDQPYLSDLAVVAKDGEPVAYALLVRWAEGVHFWYSFYDSATYGPYSLGKWLMGRVVEWAQTEGLQHAYLGTAYQPTSAYKNQGIDGGAYWDGNAWIADKERLRALQERDAYLPQPPADLFKLGL